MRLVTLKGQLIGRQVGLMALLLGLIGLSLYLILQTVLFDSTARALHGEVAVLAPIIHRSLKTHPSSDFTHLGHQLMAHLRRPGIDVLVANSHGHLIAQSTHALTSPPPFVPGPYFIWHGYLVVNAPLGNPMIAHGFLWLLAPLKPTLGILHRVLELYSVLALVVLALATWLGTLSVKSTLQPLSAIRHSTQLIASGDFGHVTDVSTAPRELAELGDAINSMSRAIHTLFEHEKGLNEQMRRFVADASHELRTPLTAIIGFLDLLGHGNLTPEEEQRGLRAVRVQGQRMGHLVTQLLTLSRLDSTPDQIPMTPVDLEQWLIETWPAAQSLTESHPLSMDHQPVRVLANPDRLTEILFNLLDNAVRYTPRETPIHVSVKAFNDQALLTVEDWGPGITEEDLPHVFERFYRSDRARTSTTGGSGLGLAIVEALVITQGGTVSVNNRPAPDSGAIFSIRFPRLTEEAGSLPPDHELS